jgi:hypothetical protein
MIEIGLKALLSKFPLGFEKSVIGAKSSETPRSLRRVGGELQNRPEFRDFLRF